MITNMKETKNTLKKSGLKPTYQRLKVLEYLNKNKNDHATVEMIYATLTHEIPTISLTTVYNTLNAFLKKGLVSAVTITGTETRYDSITTHHHHFLCKRCGKIFNIDIQCPIMAGTNKISCGHKIEEVHGYFKGLCKDCIKKKRKD